MFNPTESSHFRKYLATLGVSIALASLTASSLFFRSQPDLLIEQKKLNELTPVAQEAIKQRQEIILLITQWLPYVTPILCAIGLSLAFFGLKGWANRQRAVDEREDWEKRKLQAEVRQLSPEEIAQKEVEEAESITDLDTTATDDEVNKVAVPDEPTPTEGTVNRKHSAKRNVTPNDNYLQKIRITETTLVDKLLEAFKGQHVVPNIEITTGNKGRHIADVLVGPSNHSPAYVFEIKYIKDQKALDHAVERALVQSVAAARSLPEEYGGQNAIPVSVFVSTPASNITYEQILQSARKVGPALTIRPVVLHFKDRELMSIDPQRLRSTILNRVKNKKPLF